VSAECIFIDPIADLAVLGAPEFPLGQFDKYDDLVRPAEPLRVGDGGFSDFLHNPEPQECVGWLLSLEEWFQCRVHRMSELLSISEAKEEIAGGMSGSPLLCQHGLAIGVLSMVQSGNDEQWRGSSTNPRLAFHLPAGLLRQFS
jgi:hypothetical protein